MTKQELKGCLLPGLPAYKGGRMSDTCYDAGAGRYALFNSGKTFEYPANGSWTPWLLSQIKYAKNCGYTFSGDVHGSNFGPVTGSDGYASYTLALQNNTFSMKQDTVPFTERDEVMLMRLVTETDRTAFEEYLTQLKDNGFSIVWKNTIEDNAFFSLTKDNRRIHASFYQREGAARFVEDSVSDPIETFGGGEALPGEPMQLCQFGLYYNEKPLAANCGMLYIIKLPDNSLFLVDGGMLEQATEAACTEMMRIMHLMSKTKDGETIRIAGWFCTHAHDDHTDVFCKLLRRYHDQLSIERIIFNFPADAAWGPLLLSAQLLFERLYLYCPNAKYLKCHTGDSWNLAGVQFDVLQTHEDAATSTGKVDTHGDELDFNDSSSILKASYEGASFLVLGDINKPSEAKLLHKYSAKTLKSTVMQVAHHLINNLPALYPVVAPEYALVPQCATEANEFNGHYMTLIKTVLPQNVCFASATTDIFEVQNGRFRLMRRFPVEGYLYDGWIYAIMQMA